jgi:hypothetical protein
MLALLLGFSQAVWPQEWEKVLELAKREGKLAMIGPTGSDRRDAMVNLFQQKYGITVEYFAERGPGIGPRLSAERGAGLYARDVVVTGTTTALNSLIPAGMLDPLEPALILRTLKTPSDGAAENMNTSIQAGGYLSCRNRCSQRSSSILTW